MECHFAGCVSNCPWGRCGRGGLGLLALAHSPAFRSSAWRLGGLSGRQLTGLVAEAPEVREWVCARAPSAASRHQAELGV